MKKKRKTMHLFQDLHEPIIREIDGAQRLGVLAGETAWNYIVDRRKT